MRNGRGKRAHKIARVYNLPTTSGIRRHGRRGLSRAGYPEPNKGRTHRSPSGPSESDPIRPPEADSSGRQNRTEGLCRSPSGVRANRLSRMNVGETAKSAHSCFLTPINVRTRAGAKLSGRPTHAAGKARTALHGSKGDGFIVSIPTCCERTGSIA